MEKYQSDYSVKNYKTTNLCLISELVFLLWTEAAVLIWECRSEQNACTLVLFEALRNYIVGSTPQTHRILRLPLIFLFPCIPSFVLFSSQVTVSLHIHLPFFPKHMLSKSAVEVKVTLLSVLIDCRLSLSEDTYVLARICMRCLF